MKPRQDKSVTTKEIMKRAVFIIYAMHVMSPSDFVMHHQVADHVFLSENTSQHSFDTPHIMK